MGKTHEDSLREMAEKPPWLTGETHDKVVELKNYLVDFLALLENPDKYSTAYKVKMASNYKRVLKLWREIPRPTLVNCKRPESRLLITIRDEFFTHVELGKRDHALKVIIDVVIILVEYDPPYRQMIGWWIGRIVEAAISGKWPTGEDLTYHTWWKE